MKSDFLHHCAATQAELENARVQLKEAKALIARLTEERAEANIRWHREQQRRQAAERDMCDAKAALPLLKNDLLNLAEHAKGGKRPAGHDGDEESGRCDENCDLCFWEGLTGHADALIQQHAPFEPTMHLVGQKVEHLASGLKPSQLAGIMIRTKENQRNFRCSCGCNVFHEWKEAERVARQRVFRCNACGLLYHGDETT